MTKKVKYNRTFPKYKIYTGDTYKTLKGLKKNKFDLIISSPPYNIGKEYETKQSIENYLSELDDVIKEMVRVLSDDGSICWEVGNYIEDGEVFPLDIYFYQIFKKYGLFLKNRIVWYFGHGLHATNRFSGRYETILWFSKSDKPIFNLDSVRVPQKYPGKRHYKGEKKGEIAGNPSGKNPSDIWEISAQDWEVKFWDYLNNNSDNNSKIKIELEEPNSIDEVLHQDWYSLRWNIPNVKSNHPEKTIHPAQYPIELVERCVLALTNEGSWVLDPYSGVGSTLLACLKNNRNVVGIDREERYNEVALERINKLFRGELKIRPINKPIHKPSPNDKVAQKPKDWE